MIDLLLKEMATSPAAQDIVCTTV